MNKKSSSSTNAKKRKRLRKVQLLLKSKTTWIVIAVVLIAMIAASIVSSSFVSSRIVKLGFDNIGKLETQAAYFTNVQTIEKARDIWGWTVPFTSSKYIFSYDGVVRAGINFEDVGVRVDELTHTVHITLPEVEITDISIDPNSLKLYDESKNIFSPLKLDDVNNSLLKVEEEAEKQAIGNRILESAQENAKTLITGLLASSYDMNIYTIEYE